ncbi:MAG TPA: MFS transporter [Stellaceae bacterium]|nr:MFS transporter [Stellaceae bacterium]
MIRVRSPWWIVGASVFGLVCSGGPVNIWTFSVFLVPVSESLHVGRSVLAGALAASGPIGAICGPFVGALLDRFGARRVLLVGTVLFALATAAQSLMTAWVVGIYLLYMSRGLGAVCQTPPAYAFVVTRWFDEHRGLALGIALSGVGLGTAIIPPIAAFLIHNYGWRPAYIGVGVAILIIAGLPVLLFIREPDADERARMPHLSDPTLPGLTLREALTRSWRFWALALAFFLGIIVLNGTLSQIVAMLLDRGVTLQAATSVLAASGIAAVFGRLLSGWLLDRMHGPFIAIGFFVLLMIGTALFGSGLGEPIPLIGALLCGVANGAEVDMMGFFVSRYFGLRYYGRIMGTMFAIFVASTGLGPFISTRSFDLYHSYVPAFSLFEVILVVSIAIFSLMGPYPFPVLKRPAPPARKQEMPA